MRTTDWEFIVSAMLGAGLGAEDIAIMASDLGAPTTPDQVRAEIKRLRESGELQDILFPKRSASSGIRKDDRSRDREPQEPTPEGDPD